MTKFKLSKLNNAGLSLVELIVTILIVAIISGGAAMSFNVVYNANIDRAAKRLVAALSETREEAMAGEDEATYYLRLYQAGGDYLADICKENPPAVSGGAVTLTTLGTKAIGNSRVAIKVSPRITSGAAASYTPITEGTPVSEVLFSFGKKRGELVKTTTINDTGTPNDSDSALYVDLMVSGNVDNNIIIVPATGRSYIYKE